MSGGLQLWPMRIIAGGFVAVVVGVSATLQSSVGGVVSVERLDIGTYRVTLRSPGLRMAPLAQSIVIATAYNVLGQPPDIIRAEVLSDTQIRFETFEVTGSQSDSSFNFIIIAAERTGGVA